MRFSIHIVTKGRNDCLALLLESLRTQTHKEWDIVILDNNLGQDKNEATVQQHFLCQSILNRLQFDGHRVCIIGNGADTGARDIGRYRNMVIEGDPFAVRADLAPDLQRTNTVGVRIDDDTVLEADYLKICSAGFNAVAKTNILKPVAGGTNPQVAIVGGICPYYWMPQTYAPMPAKFNEVTRFWEWTDNCVNFYRILNDRGADVPWMETYFESGHIRSNYAYRIDIAREIKFPEHTGQTGFSEETYFSCKVWMSGHRILINPNAIAWHFNTPYGGGRDLFVGKERPQEEMEKIKVANMARLKEELEAFRISKGLEPRAYP